jgi:glycine cleavage system H protein
MTNPADAPREWIRFKHARFSARFPGDFRYSPSHYWMAPAAEDPGLWRVGFTKFATRMLGELVDFTFEMREGDAVSPGQMIGWVEGFKAASDVFCVMSGTFAGLNPALQADACLVRSDPYIAGWLYAVRGEPEPGSLDVHGYVELLNATIERLQEQEHSEPQ